MEVTSNTEQKILDAAEVEFLDEGFSGARMQTIADRAGINKALLHYYFRSKDKLFELVLRHKMNQFVPQLTQSLEDEQIPVIEKIELFVSAYLTMLSKNPKLPLFIIGAINRNPELVSNMKIPIGHAVIKALEKAMSQGKINKIDPHQFILTLVGMCIFPFVARPMFIGIFGLSPSTYDKLIEERQTHIMQYVQSILENK